jgi:hypothetical protein
LWGELKNGDLIDCAQRDGYEVLVTADQGIFHQQNNEKREIALVVLSTNDWHLLQQHIDAINAAVLRSKRGSFELVQIPADPGSRRRWDDAP